jgi:hypothetical protein
MADIQAILTDKSLAARLGSNPVYFSGYGQPPVPMRIVAGSLEDGIMGIEWPLVPDGVYTRGERQPFKMPGSK